ncbi:MAG: hypothetical protein KA243_01720 [Candidatus Aminicenantes bacterium]|nr:hypothetical protein [Candidatus Aminicenantes bacterium]
MRWIILAGLGSMLAGIAAILLAKFILIETKAAVVDPRRYLGRSAGSADVYGKPGSGALYSPFNARVAPMDKLLLVDFKGDPVYASIELQTFDDARGRAARVLMYPHQGPADYYYSDPAFVDPSETDRNHVVPEMRHAFEVTASGLDAWLSMRDKAGTRIEFMLRETSHKKWAQGFLAPVGGSRAVTFRHFPLYHMKNMNFMPRSGAAPVVTIGGERRTPATLPVPLNREFVYLTRYTDSPVIGQWNRPYDGELPALRPVRPLECQDGGTTYELADRAGHLEIRGMISRCERHAIRFEFSPAIPDLPALEDGAAVDGRFAAGADEVHGIVAGTYRVHRRGPAVEMEIRPLKGWQPFPGESWVRAWAWKGTITVGPEGRVFLISAWNRREPAG